MAINKPLLRSVLKNLRAVPYDRRDYSNSMMAPQEMLDFLAMVAGIKPVYLLGRGFDDGQWVKGVIDMADRLGLHIINGSEWDASGNSQEFPAWFAPGQQDHEVFYVTRTRGNAEAVDAAIKNPPITMEAEARLLDYPLCCVEDHYHRDALMKRAYYMMLQRTGGGDVPEMQRLIREDVQLATATPEEESMLAEAGELRPAPFTSINMCPACAADPQRPAGRVSRRYEALAATIDETFRQEIAAIPKPTGSSE
jgi:hypothetical protein